MKGHKVEEEQKLAKQREQRGAKSLHAARKALYASTNESSRLPNLDDAAAERKLTARTSGGKAVHSGAFDSLEKAPDMLRIKKRK